MSIWNEAIEQCVEGQSTPEQLARLLMRIDLPDEGRRAINATLAMVGGLDQIHRLPEPSAGAIPKLLDALRNQPAPEGIESFSAWVSSASAHGAEIGDLPETENASEEEEFRQLAAALDSFHGSIPMPPGARDRLLDRLGGDVRAASDDAGVDTDDENDDNVPYRGYFTGGDNTRDVLAASRETPPPVLPPAASPGSSLPGEANTTKPEADKQPEGEEPS